MPNFDFKEIEKIIPIAVQTGNLSGAKIIAKIYPPTGDDYTSFLLSPDYLPVEAVPDYIVESAIVKYEYFPLKEKTIIKSKEEFNDFLKLQK